MKKTGMNRLVVVVAVFACGLAACAMPTKEELVQAQALVADLTADDVRAMKSGAKKPGEVAAAQLALADEAETEAGKYLLLQGAFRLYARSADYDAAADVLARMRKDIADLPPEVVVELVNGEMRRVAADKAPKVLAIFRDAQRTIKCRKNLDAAETAAKARPGNAAVQRRLAECHAGLGDWAKALEIFAKIGDEAAKYELDPSSTKGYDALKAANYWWEYQAKDDEPFKVHAAVLYQKGLADGSISGLRKTLAEKRVKQMEAVMPTEGDDSAASGSGGSQPLATPGKQPTALYCVIDLSAGPIANKYPVSYLDAEPKGGWTDEYKMTKLVLRRIEPGTFKMGGKYEVTLTKPYYIGIFEMTQKQYRQVTGSNHSRFNDDMQPVEMVSWNTIRGDSATYNWPTSANVDSSSFMGKIQARTGLNFDLPTEAQWEYACRAGGDGDFGGTGRIDDMGWYKDNSGGTTHVAGEKQANAWGLYDMHGNVGEWCLDWYGNLSGGEADPLGSFSGSQRVLRGGCWCERFARNCTSSSRYLKIEPSSPSSHFGFRLCMNPEGPVGVSVQGSGAPAASDNGTTEPSSTKVGTATLSPTPVVNGKEISVKLATGVTMDFVPCPAGSFEMGCDDFDQSPQYKHKVTITRPFWIGKYQVTRAAWNLYHTKESLRHRTLAGETLLDECGGLKAAKSLYPSYDEVVGFANWLSKYRKSVLPKGYVFRLPTEAEWEYALYANGGKPGNPYIKWRDGDESVRYQIMVTWEDYAKILGEKASKINKWGAIPSLTVGTKLPNDWGIYDMLGNGREFVLDTLDDTGWSYNKRQNAPIPVGNLLYEKSETDPVHICSDVKKACAIMRGTPESDYRAFAGSWFGKSKIKLSQKPGLPLTFRLVIAPDLLKERGIKLPNLGK